MARPVVVMIMPYLERGGTERHVAHLVNALAGYYDFILIAPNGPALDLFQVKVTHLSFTRFDHSWFKGIQELKQILLNIDQFTGTAQVILHVHAAPDLLILTRRWAPQTQIVFTVHGFHGPLLDWNYRFAAWTIHRYANHAICISQSEYQKLTLRDRNQEKLSLVSNGIPEQEQVPDAPPALHLNPQLPVVGCVARMEPPKGIEFLIKAAAILTAKKTPIQLVLVGSGSDESRLKTLAGQFQDTKIIFTGSVPNAGPYYQLFDLAVIPSLVEPQGIVAMEAMRAGKAVISSKVGGLQEVVIHEETGYHVPPGSPEAIAGAIQNLLSNSELRSKMGEQGQKRFLKYYTIAQMTQSIAKIYKQMLKPTSKPSSP